MDEMPSSEFRRRYATLTEPVVVIVNGRPIGQYIPATTSIVYTDYSVTSTTGASEISKPRDPVLVGRAFSSRPFSPAPKKGHPTPPTR